MINIFKGIVIGLAFIIPGVSGGTLMVMMHLYDKAIDSIVNFMKRPKKNAMFLATIGLGAIIGILVFSRVLNYMLLNFECPTKFVFIGLIVGGIPATYKTIIEKKNTKINWYLVLLTLLISITLFIVEKHFINYSIEEQLSFGKIPFIAICIAGMLYASGKIIPGISGTALLMLIGMYNYLIDIIANIENFTIDQFKILIPFILSFLISALILFKLINYLLKKHYSTTYSLILGFIIGSVIYVLPSFNTNSIDIVLSIILSILVALLTYKISIKKSVK